jgi:hypothetical protein
MDPEVGLVVLQRGAPPAERREMPEVALSGLIDWRPLGDARRFHKLTDQLAEPGLGLAPGQAVAAAGLPFGGRWPSLPACPPTRTFAYHVSRPRLSTRTNSEPEPYERFATGSLSNKAPASPLGGLGTAR